MRVATASADEKPTRQVIVPASGDDGEPETSAIV
jgi:hypothetical protein